MAQAADSTKITGWISDSMCGAKHAGTRRRLREEVHRGRNEAGVCGRCQERGLEHRQPGCGEGLLRRPCDRDGDRGCVARRACISTRSSRPSRFGPWQPRTRWDSPRRANSGSVVSAPLGRPLGAAGQAGWNRLEATGHHGASNLERQSDCRKRSDRGSGWECLFPRIQPQAGVFSTQLHHFNRSREGPGAIL